MRIDGSKKQEIENEVVVSSDGDSYVIKTKNETVNLSFSEQGANTVEESLVEREILKILLKRLSAQSKVVQCEEFGRAYYHVERAVDSLGRYCNGRNHLE